MSRWVGASVPRKEDRRLLLGRSRFVADLNPTTRRGPLHAAFVRSPHAHARLVGINAAAAATQPGVAAVFTAASLGDPYLLAVLDREEFIPTRMPVLTGEVARFVGEPVALVVADDPYRAEDAAELVEVNWDPRPAVMSIETARAAAAPRLHQEADGNCLVDLLMFDDDRLTGIFADATLVISATFDSGRVAALPLEGRACLAEWDDRHDQLVMHASTQVPHQVRSGVAQALGVPERQVRVIAPDVGGGFGLKCVVGREEVAVAAAAWRLRQPVCWAEDRQENLTAAFHGHEQRYRVRAAFDDSGKIQALDAEIDCDTGAYSAFPFTCAVEPLMAATELPGVYKVPAYRARGRAIATNKAPAAPYRGVSRPQIVLVMERLMEKAAAALGLDPLHVRRMNLIGPGEFPYQGVNEITYDQGSYRESLDLAEKHVAKRAWAAERDQIRRAGLRAGIGYACFSERTAYGTPAMSQRRMRMTPGYDTAVVRMDPTGEVVVTTGTCGHGQGHETTFAQIVADRLGVHPDQVRLRQGDTDLASYGWGTWGSRSVVIGGGAASRAADLVAGQLRKAAAHLLEASPADVELAQGRARIRGDDEVSIPIAELARVMHFQARRLAEDLRYGLEARASYDPPGTFSNACHVAMVTIDHGTCAVRLHRYLVVEDCGVVINPMAMFVEKSGLGPQETADITVSKSGAVHVYSGGTSMGQGIETVLAQIAADALGVDPGMVRVVAGDTAAQPFGAGSWASRTTVVGGSAVHQAATAVRERAVQLAARMLEAAEEDLDLAGGSVTVRGDLAARLTLAEIALAAEPASGYLRPGEPAGLSARRRFEVSRMTYPYGAHAAVVEVDQGTGQVRVLRYLVAYEVGRAVNPILIEGQLRGGVAQGIGGALMEEFGYDDAGQPQAISFLEYRMPTAAEVPPVDVLVSQDAPAPGNPLGVMGAGEGGVNAVGAAVANAVRDALGLAGSVGQLPLTPARVRALCELREGTA